MFIHVSLPSEYYLGKPQGDIRWSACGNSCGFLRERATLGNPGRESRDWNLMVHIS